MKIYINDLVKGHSDVKVKCLTFGLYTQVSDSGPLGPLVDGVIANADIRFVGEKSCLLNSFYIFHRIHLKFCRLPSYLGSVILIIEELFPFFTR